MIMNEYRSDLLKKLRSQRRTKATQYKKVFKEISPDSNEWMGEYQKLNELSVNVEVTRSRLLNLNGHNPILCREIPKVLQNEY
ncbi:MAG: hypothetical protein CL843_01910 [Crocinitomicaceae bacterium]|nr:hypothetical protein [Crocinitomicaceae bacterium]|tara:strand:+ start:1241 stop:1489 length:249 start_codon:yes stop_codon:yes gene_type:complete